MNREMRAYAWVHFATSAKHATSERQQAEIADLMLIEFDKRFPDTYPTLASSLETGVEKVLKAGEEVVGQVESVAGAVVDAESIGGETLKVLEAGEEVVGQVREAFTTPPKKK